MAVLIPVPERANAVPRVVLEDEMPGEIREPILERLDRLPRVDVETRSSRTYTGQQG